MKIYFSSMSNRCYLSIFIISLLISSSILFIFAYKYEIRDSNSLKLYDGSKIEKDIAIPINFLFQDAIGLPVLVNSSDSINISWKGFYFSFTIDFGDKYHFHITEINSSGYWGRIILLDLETNQYISISEIYNLTQTIIWRDEEQSPEFYYRESLRLNSLSNITSTFDQEKNIFTITELGTNGTIKSELIVNTLIGVAKFIRIYNSSSLIGTFTCKSVELSFPAYNSEKHGINLNEIFLIILGGLIIIIFSLLIITNKIRTK